jgi:hypothetical protein
MSEDALAVARRQIESLQNGELRAAQHVGRLYEQREMLIIALTAMLADHAMVRGHDELCESCKSGHKALAEVRRLKQKYG